MFKKYSGKEQRFRTWFRIIAQCVAITVFATSLPAPRMAIAGDLADVPSLGQLVPVSPEYLPPTLQGIKIYPDNPFRFDFLIDPGESMLNEKEQRDEFTKLIKYFLAALTIPTEDLWVNLSPYEEDRIMTDAFGVTQMGRDLLIQDYMLKQMSASVIYPESDVGESYWESVFDKFYHEFGTTEVPVEMINKVWVVPQKAQVFVDESHALITESKLEVLLSEDYQHRFEDGVSNSTYPTGDQRPQQQLWQKLFRKHMLPEIQKDVNLGQNFNELRQIYHAVILATWYRRHLWQSLFASQYVGQEKVAGVDIQDRDAKQKIYQQYLKAIKRGVYDYIKEDYDPVSEGIIARRYFSGGIVFSDLDKREGVYEEVRDASVLSKIKVRTKEHLDRLYYLVSSVVISKEGVQNYQKLELASQDTGQHSIPNGISTVRLTQFMSGAYDRFRSAYRSVSLLASAAFLSTALGMGMPAQAAQFTYDDQGRFTVVVEQGDDFGEIVEDLRVANKRYDAMGYRAPLRGEFWGPDGAVYAMANRMERNDLSVNPGDVLVIPDGMVSPKTQVALAGPQPYTPPTLRIPGKVEIPQWKVDPIDTVERDVKPADLPRLQDWQEAPIILDDRDKGPGDTLMMEEGQRLGDGQIEVAPEIQTMDSNGFRGKSWALWGLLSLVGAGLLGVLLYRSQTGRAIPSKEVDLETPPTAPNYDDLRKAQLLVIQEALRIRVQKLSARYTEHPAKLQQKAVDVSRSIADYLEENLYSLLPDDRGIIAGYVNEYFFDSLLTTVEQVYTAGISANQLDGYVDAWTEELALKVVDHSIDSQTVDAEVRRFVDTDLDLWIDKQEAQWIQKVNQELFSPQWMRVYQARLDSFLRQRMADEHKLSNLPGVLAEASDAILQIITEEGYEATKPKLQLTVGQSKAEIAHIIRSRSPEYRRMLRMAYQQAEFIRDDILGMMIDGNDLPTGITRESALLYLRLEAGHELDRLLEGELDRRSDYLQIETTVDEFAAELSAGLREEDAQTGESARLLRGFIDIELKETVQQAIESASEALQAQVLSDAMREVYRISFEKAMRTEVAVANGAPIKKDLIYAQAINNVLMALRDDMQFTHQAIIPPPKQVLALAESRSDLQNMPVTPLEDRLNAPAFDISRADILAAIAGVSLFAGSEASAANGLMLAASPFLFRLGVSASYWLHEFTHVAAAGRAAFTSENLRANVSWREWINMLIPFSGTVPSDLHVKAPNKWWNHLSAVGTSVAITLGLGVSGLSVIGSSWNDLLQVIAPLFIGSTFVLVGALQTDVIHPLLKRLRPGENCCGVAILLGKRQQQDEPVVAKRLLGIYKRMGEITNIRGQQAAGAVISARTRKGMSTFVGDRRVNPKHGDLPEGLEKQIKGHVRAAKGKGYQATDTTMMFGHYRYGTTSAPAKKETHPHRFVEPRDVRYWSLREGNFEQDTRNLEIYIVHNGDFNYWQMGGMKHSNSHIGFWLERVLDVTDETDGDSPKISGMMNFLRTQGIFSASIRYAYYSEISTRMEDVFDGQHPRDILPDFSESLVQPSEEYIRKKTQEAKKKAPNTALTQSQITELAGIFDVIFSEVGDTLLHSQARSMADLWVSRLDTTSANEEWKVAQRARIEAFSDRLKEKITTVDWTQDWTEEERSRFIDTALEAFFTHDEFTAVRKFLQDAQGSFGMGLATSLNPGGVVVAADGQPLSLGMDKNRQNMMIASEFSALKVAIDDQGQKLDYRFALKQDPGRGEIVDVQANGQFHVYSRETQRILSDTEIRQRLVPLKNNPYVTQLTELNQDDPVGQDIAETAGVLAEIRGQWSQPDSMNRQSMDNLQLQIVRKHIQRRIKKTSVAYMGIHNAMSRQARQIVRQDLKGYLQEELGSKIPLMEGAWSNLGLDQFIGEVQHLVEIALDQAFPWHAVNENIGNKAEELARRQAAGVLTLDQLQDEMDIFIDHLLADVITTELQQAKILVEEIVTHWQPVIAAEIVFEWTRANAQQKVDQLDHIGRKAVVQWKGIWEKLNIRLTRPPELPKTDVLITGLETSLWMGEQFAQDLQFMFPEMVVKSDSANKILEDPLATGLDEDTIVIAVSQSGQTFPTLNATILLDKITHRKVFVVTGEYDTLMGQAVGQKFQPDSPFGGRIFSNFTGFRHAEASSVTATATHATFTEVLIQLADGLHEKFPYDSPYGLNIQEEQLSEVKLARDKSLEETARITGVDTDGQAIESSEKRQILKQARNWARNVLDAPLSVILTKINLYATVISGFFIFVAIANKLPVVGGLAGTLFVASFLQAVYYDYFSGAMNFLLRKITGREMLDRIGKRTVVIGDKAYVHQSLEAFLSKLNSLSRGIVGVDVHGANPGDHMISRFGHRVVRGTMIWIGVPDGRMSTLHQRQSSVEMTAKQGKGVRNRILGRGIGPNVVTIGRKRVHNPNVADSTIIVEGDTKVTSTDLESFVENRFDSMTRLVAGQVFFHAMQKQISTAGLSKPWRWLWYWRWNIHRTQSGPRIATTQSPVDAEILEQLDDRPIYPASGVRDPIRRPDGGQRYDQEYIGKDSTDKALLASTDVKPEKLGGIDLRESVLDIDVQPMAPVTPLNGLPPDFILDPVIIDALPVNGFTPIIIDVKPVNAIYFLGEGREGTDPIPSNMSNIPTSGKDESDDVVIRSEEFFNASLS